LLLAVDQAASASSPAVEQEITVIGRKLKTWRADYAVRGSQMACRTKKSTGDREIDAIGCQSFEQCVAKLRPRIDQSDRPDLAMAERKQMKVSIKRDLRTCVDARRDELIADLADRRFRARAGS
jgi:hypothetical protein